MTPAFDDLVRLLKSLPGLGFRSAEKVALHLLVENTGRCDELTKALEQARREVHRCSECGNLAENDLCPVCESTRRNQNQICVVETIPDLVAIEKSGAYQGVYHVLFGKLSPLRGVGPDQLNLARFWERLGEEGREEVVLALSNDLEGEATCHYLQEEIGRRSPGISVSRIGFGLPSGSSLLFADGPTLKNAMASRRPWGA